MTGTTKWCSGGVLGPQTCEWWAGNVMDGHAYCRMEATWYDDYHVHCCGSEDNRRAKACDCACHAPRWTEDPADWWQISDRGIRP